MLTLLNDSSQLANPFGEHCGDERGPFECDHVYPLARGGDSSEGNLTTACSPCNRSKRDMTVEEWRAPK